MNIRKSLINQDIKASTVAPKNYQISFLLEGFYGNSNTPHPLPEVSAAVKLAETNQCEYFDLISSYDAEHLRALLKDKTEIEQKAILLCIYMDFIVESSSKNIIENLFKKRYQEIFGKIPTWLSQLNSSTISSFTVEVMCDLFYCHSENFQIYRNSIKKETNRLSDEISASRLITYINDRPQLKTIYALIGKNHLNMLNPLGEVIIQEDNYRLIKIAINNRIINVHLCGGIHGKMAHYERLAKCVKEKDSIKNIFGMFQNKDPQFSEEKSTLSSAVYYFDFWMKEYDHPQCSDTELLVQWLHYDGGGENVKNYEEFCELAILLAHQKGYATNPPPTESEFNKGMENYHRRLQDRNKF